MKVFVYGTLKSGYWNNVILKRGGAQLLDKSRLLKGYSLLDTGIPWAIPSVPEGDDRKVVILTSAILGEVWDISGPNQELTLSALDRLESNGVMYTRTYIPEQDFWVYLKTRNNYDDTKSMPTSLNFVNPDNNLRVYYWERVG